MLSTHSACDLCLSGLWGLPELAPPPRLCQHTRMNISTALHISPAHEPETLMALTLRYVENHEEVADQYLRAALRFFMSDLYPHEAFKLVHCVIVETVNDIRELEGEGVATRISAALWRLVDRAEADEAFMAELTDRAY